MKIKIISEPQISEFFELFKEIVYSDFEEWTDESKRKWIEDDYSLEFWKKLISEDKLPVFVAFEDGKMLGYLAIESIDYGVAYLGWVAVLNKFRGRGIARKLFVEAEDWAIKKGQHKTELETQVINLLPLFIKLGYELEGVRKNSWQNLDNYMFGKTLEK